ncbi:MAG: D-2-hydroxyacid dehydrogenase [Armatimonadetes bacterium]|nr:D-2-hydroxyacid dehydrogenase [Armatimonadota bacterium]MDW8154402.1 D-2-hydroxyacid dehydrogenase [Armatimonadota bacterium]
MGDRCVVVCTVRIGPSHEAMIRAVDSRVELRVVPRPEALDHAAEAEVWVGWDLPEEALERADRLRWVHSTAAGVENLLPKLAGRGLLLTNSRGIHAIPMAEHVLGCLLVFARNLHLAFRHQLHRRWQPEPGGELWGATVGILGLGAIGQEVARRCRAFGARIVGLRRVPAPVPGVEEVYGPEGLETVLRVSDYVVLALPLTPQTRGLLGARELGWMRPGAVLVNVGRGALVDERALVEALRAGRLRGAALDVFETEPLPPDHPLWDLPNVLITPHISGNSPRYMDRAIPLFCENLRRYLRGEGLRNVVDPELGY